jgi:hypothetical protein
VLIKKSERRRGRGTFAATLTDQSGSGWDRRTSSNDLIRAIDSMTGLTVMTRKGVELAVLSANRDVIARQKRMCAELVAGFIVVVLVGIVIKNPACMFGAARLVDETADLVVLARPEPSNLAVVTILPPEDWIDVSYEIEGRNKIISMA